MKRKNLIYILGKNVEVDNNVSTLSEENYDPDIWLGMLERDIVTIEYNKRKELDLKNEKEKKNYNSKTSRNYISKAMTRIAMPAVVTVVVASLGLVPGIDNLNLFDNWNVNNEASIVSNIDENVSMDKVFKCRVLNGTKTLEIDNLAVTRNDNNTKVDSNTIAPGTSGEFMIEIDATRNRGSTGV